MTGAARTPDIAEEPPHPGDPCCCGNSTDSGHTRADHAPACGSLDSYGVPCTCPSFDLLTLDG